MVPKFIDIANLILLSVAFTILLQVCIMNPFLVLNLGFLYIANLILLSVAFTILLQVCIVNPFLVLNLGFLSLFNFFNLSLFSPLAQPPLFFWSLPPLLYLIKSQFNLMCLSLKFTIEGCVYELFYYRFGYLHFFFCVNFGEVCLFQDLILVVSLVILMSNLVYNVRYWESEIWNLDVGENV